MEHQPESPKEITSQTQLETVELAETANQASSKVFTGGKFVDSQTIRRARVNPTNLRRSDILQLQSIIGNRAVQRLLANQVVQRDTPAIPAEEQKMNAALQTSALGKQALAIKSKYSITLEWTDTGAAGYEETGNKCFINRTLDGAEAASYFVHEMHHAEEYKSGKSKGPQTYKDDEEDVYVTKMVNEEIDGTVLQLEAMLEIGAPAKLSGTMSDIFPRYKRVREDWINKYLKEHPGDNDGATKLGKEKCKKLVNWFITSSTDDYDRTKSKANGKTAMPTVAPRAIDTYEDYYVRLFQKSRSQKTTPPTQPAEAK